MKKTNTNSTPKTTRERKTKLTFTFYFKEIEKGKIEATCPTLNEEIKGNGETQMLAKNDFISQFNALHAPSIEKFRDSVKEDSTVTIHPIELKEVRKRAKKPAKKK